MKIKEMVNQTVQSGIQPLQIVYDAIRFFDREEKILRTFLEVNSLDLGHLTYEQYRFVARRTKLGNELCQRHIEKVFREYPKLIQKKGVSCITVPVYARFLLAGDLSGVLFDALAYFEGVSASKICIEISADILYEDMQTVKARIEEIAKMGFKIAVCEVGDEFCPVFRLAEIPFDYAFVDKFVVDSLQSAEAERVAGGIVKFLQFVGVKTIAPNIEKRKEVALAQTLGFDGYSLAKPSQKDKEGTP